LNKKIEVFVVIYDDMEIMRENVEMSVCKYVPLLLFNPPPTTPTPLIPPRALVPPNVYMFVYIHKYIYIYMYMHMYIYIYIHIYAYVYI
jgi:hypothetical protein